MKRSGNRLGRGLKNKKRFTKESWEEFCKTYQRLYPEDEPLGEKEREYLETHLTDMDHAKKAWYFHAMRTWTKKDYDSYEQIQLWMLGEPTKDLKKAKTIDLVEKILRKKRMIRDK